jgi:hypothetical protein
MPAVQLNR